MRRKCVYCSGRAGIFGQVCGDCKRLLDRVQELRGKVSYGQFLDGLEQTGIDKEKILRFLTADPDGRGSIRDQVTAEMTSELMQVMGISGRQTAQEVKRIRDSIDNDSE
ncbi:MAG TPA: hypothetical protein VIE90_13930 [Candidatus Binatia bacterium]|jgi:hypothetical protein